MVWKHASTFKGDLKDTSCVKYISLVSLYCWMSRYYRSSSIRNLIYLFSKKQIYVHYEYMLVENCGDVPRCIDKIAFASGFARKLTRRDREKKKEKERINSIPIVLQRYVLNMREEKSRWWATSLRNKFPPRLTPRVHRTNQIGSQVRVEIKSTGTIAHWKVPDEDFIRGQSTTESTSRLYSNYLREIYIPRYVFFISITPLILRCKRQPENQDRINMNKSAKCKN